MLKKNTIAVIVLVCLFVSQAISQEKVRNKLFFKQNKARD